MTIEDRSELERQYRQDLTELAQVHLRELDKRDAEIARLRETLGAVRNDLTPIHMCDVVHPCCKICEAVLRIDAALMKTKGNV